MYEDEIINLKKVGVICSERLSDGLMMMVASHRLHNEGAEVTTFHSRLQDLQTWFQGHTFAYLPDEDQIEEVFGKFDLVIIQYDSTPYVKEVIRILNERCPKVVMSIFYPTYSRYANPPLTIFDRVFNRHLPMVDNIALAIASLLHKCEHSKNNGLLAPDHLLHRKYKRRVTILPSRFVQKKYEKIAHQVERCGFDPLIIDSDDLSHGASLIFESGYFIGPECDLCHLASNLQVPTLVVSGNKKPLNLLRPGWYRSAFIARPRLIPKAFEKFVMPGRVVKAFKKLVSKDRIYI